MIEARDARVLHVAALPFPTRQGTQALLHEMLQAFATADRAARLLCYAASGFARDTDYDVSRAAAFGRPSLRSGPSLAKLMSDAALLRALRVEVRRLPPDVIVAHHVEAAAIATGTRPRVFFAHTDLAQELPSYAARALVSPLRRAGAAVDRVLGRRAQVVATVSPALRDRFCALVGERARACYVPPPWRLQAQADRELGRRVRRRLAIAAEAAVLLYAGNLDRYQGWWRLIAALRELPRCTLLLGTESDPSPALELAREAGVIGRVRVSRLDGERARHELHSAADVVLVVREARGGVPIKLLDALSRGCACVVSPAATAGLPLRDVVVESADDGAAALAAAVRETLTNGAAREFEAAGPKYVAREHSGERFIEAFDEVLGMALGQARDRPSRH